MLWRAQGTLFVADMHLGKAAAFRAAGVAAPEQATPVDLSRLGTLIDATGVERLVVLGDLLHAAAGRTPAVLDLVARWRRAFNNIDIVLVRGNHDRKAGDPPPAWNMRCVEPGEALGPFMLHHEPDAWMLHDECARGYALAGHVHPAVIVRDQGALAKRGSHRRLPAFVIGQRRALLPSFGSFTGTGRVSPALTDRVFVLLGDDTRSTHIAELPVIRSQVSSA